MSTATKQGSRSPTAVSPPPPAEFDEYRLLRRLGSGDGGLVYLAEDTLLDRLVAVKFVRAPDRRSLEDFLVEARAAARIQHPNVATLYRVGQVDDGAYLISEFVRGRSLADVAVPLPWQRTLEIGCDLLRGLSAAHRRGVLHCDLNLANALLTDEGQVKIVDFGLARLLLSPAGGAQHAERPLVGNPSFIPPEAWKGEELTVRSDLYAFGMVVYELCAGRGPFDDVPPHLIGHLATEREAAPLGSLAPEVDPRFAAVVDRCLRRDPSERFASAEEILDELDRLRPGRRLPVPEGNPYRGLQAFQPEHRALFFGRSRDRLAILERLRSEPMVLVAGDSGVGKSSLCLAAVVPAIKDGELGPARKFRIARLVPGRRPLAALAAAVAPEDPDAAEAALRNEPATLARRIRQELGEESGFVVFVDQLEELLTLGKEEAPAFATAIGELAAGYDGIRVLATVRNDFLGPLSALPGLGEIVPRALHLLRNLGDEELREAIVGPANAKGFRFESADLVRDLATATSAEKGGLPLLQFTLAEVWEGRDREHGLITAAAVDALGGVSGALCRHADCVLERLVPAQKEAARRLLLRLATPERTRSRHTREELTGTDPVATSALEALVQGRLLVVRDGAIELAHEAVLTAWPTLAGFMAEESGEDAARQRVEAAAVEWESSGREREALWGARRLQEMRSVDRTRLTPSARDFLAASAASVHRLLLRRRASVLTAVLAIAALWVGSRMLRQHELDEQVQGRLQAAAESFSQARAQAAALESARAEAFRLFDGALRAKGEEAWQHARGLAARSDLAFAGAAEKFEDALLVGGGRNDVRAAFADFLAARASYEDRPAQRDEFLGRLRLYDPSGDRLRAFQADAVLSMTTTPPGAQLRIAKMIDEDGIRRPGPERDLGVSPIGAVRLAPGTYQIAIAAPGRPRIEVPVQLQAAEQRRLAIDVPAANAVPGDFAYVPPGQSWFGTSADESVRQFFNTVPLHRIETGAFFIARHETTYAQFIEYLKALPASERKTRSPHVGGTGLSGQLDLREGSTGFELALQIGSKVQVLREGDKLRLPRADHAEQDWLRLPVAGVSFADARAYAQWLSATRRVPGARLCTEREWERAARGADDREFPGGDILPPADANFDATYGKQPKAFGPDEVGSHPGSRSPFGVDDLAGNVWEWVESSLVPGEAVARGGSAYATRDTCRSVNREIPEPSFRAAVLGVRVCATPGPSR